APHEGRNSGTRLAATVGSKAASGAAVQGLRSIGDAAEFLHWFLADARPTFRQRAQVAQQAQRHQQEYLLLVNLVSKYSAAGPTDTPKQESNSGDTRPSG